MFGCVVLLHECGGLREWRDELRGWVWIGVPRPVDSRLRGNDGLKDYEDLQDWDDAGGIVGVDCSVTWGKGLC